MLSHRAGRLPVSRHLLRRGALPLRDGALAPSSASWRRCTTGCRSGRATCTTRSWARCTSGRLDHHRSTCRSSRSTSSALQGMPRRYSDYADAVRRLELISSIGAFVFGLSQLMFVYIIIKAYPRRRKAWTDQVWEGADGLEWTLSSPPPYHSFHRYRREVTGDGGGGDVCLRVCRDGAAVRRALCDVPWASTARHRGEAYTAAAEQSVDESRVP
jgi:hypothetical protein